MSGNAGSGGKERPRSRLQGIVAHVAPSGNSKDGDLSKAEERSSLSSSSSMDARTRFELEDHAIDDHRNLKASSNSIPQRITY